MPNFSPIFGVDRDEEDPTNYDPYRDAVSTGPQGSPQGTSTSWPTPLGSTGGVSGVTGGEDVYPFPVYGGPSRPSFNFPALPKTAYPAFDWKTADFYLDPGYKFALSEGIRGLENSASGRGVARTGGSLKDIAAWGTNYADQMYGGAFNRALQAYDRAFGKAKEEFLPQMAEWQTKADAERYAGLASYDQAWKQYLADLDWRKFGITSALGG